MIDTSSSRSGLALIGAGGEVLAERTLHSGRGLDIAGQVEAMTDPTGVSAVAVALGPGSFTGLRVGVAYGVGLALGLGARLLGLETLALCRARVGGPALGLSEAGRGRVYHAREGEEPRLGEPRDLPTDLPAAGWLRPDTARAVREAGVQLLDEAELRSFGAAAASLIGQAPELDYGRVKLLYMQSFGAVD